MRVLALIGTIAWCSATAVAQETRTGTTDSRTTTTTRATTTVPPSPTSVLAGTINFANIPVSLDLAKMTCVARHDSPVDETFALIVVMDMDWEKPWLSKVKVMTSQVYPFFGGGQFWQPNLAVWGLDGAAMPLENPQSALVLAGVWVRGKSQVEIARTAVAAKLIERMNSVHPGDTYSQISSWMITIIHDTMDLYAERIASGGANRIGKVQRLSLTQGDIDNARRGIGVTKTLEFYDQDGKGYPGKYVLSFQLGK